MGEKLNIMDYVSDGAEIRIRVVSAAGVKGLAIDGKGNEVDGAVLTMIAGITLLRRASERSGRDFDKRLDAYFDMMRALARVDNTVIDFSRLLKKMEEAEGTEK